MIIIKTVQIRIPEELLKKADEIIEKGLFRSRSHLLRESLNEFIKKFNNIGSTPFILGPFTPKEIKLLNKDPKSSLSVPKSKLKEVTNLLKNLNV